MANFHNHLRGSTFVSITAAVVCSHYGYIKPEQTATLVFFGMVGGMLPDIDSDNGYPLRFIFWGFVLACVSAIETNPVWTSLGGITPKMLAAVFICGSLGVISHTIYIQVKGKIKPGWAAILCVLFFISCSLGFLNIPALIDNAMWNYIHGLIPKNNLILHMAAVWGVVACLFFIVLPAFKRWTTHRGILHSILAVYVFYLITVLFTREAMGFDTELSFMCGYFIAGGSIVHLTMDEIWSLRVIKKPRGIGWKITAVKSFGTAFKMLGWKWYNNVAFGIVAVALTKIIYYK